MALHEDRRRIAVRLSVLQYGLIVALRRSRSASGCCRWCSTRSSRRWPKTTTSARSRCVRRAAWSSIAKAGCSSKTATPSAFRSSASTPPISSARSECSSQCLGSEEAAFGRSSIATAASRPTGRSRLCRTRPWRRSAPSRRAGSLRTARRLHRRGADARSIPRSMAAHLFGYVGEVNDAQVSRRHDAEERRHRRPDRGSRRSTTRC